MIILGKTLKWYNLLEIIYPIHVLLSPLWMDVVSNADPGYMENAEDPLRFFTAFIQIPLLGLIMFLALRRWLGSKDTRYQILIHIVPGLLTGLFSAAIFAFYGQTMPVDSPWETYRLFVYTIPTLLYLFMVFYAGFITLEPYRAVFETLTNEFDQGTFDARIKDSKVLADPVYGTIANFMNKNLDTLNEYINSVQHSNIQLGVASSSLVSNMDILSNATREVSDTSNSMSQGAATQAELMSNILEMTIETSSLLSQVVNDIQNRTQQVSQISLQTNILALNAGIEASRAGDYGRGFAVVAENVRKLSDETKHATSQIEEVVSRLTEFSLNNFSNIQREVENVSSISEETSASAEEVAAIMEEISSAIVQIEGTTSNLKELIKNN